MTTGAAPLSLSETAAPLGAQQRFENLINCIDGIVWEADPATLRMTFVSAQAEHMLGYPIADWYAEGFWEAHIHPQDREQTMAYCATHAKGDCNYSLEYRMLAADGHVVWLKDFVSVGQSISLCGIMLDITERRQLAAALEAKNSLLQKVIDHIPCGISLTDADLNIILLNQRAQAILDVPDCMLQADKTPLEDFLRFNAQRGEYGPGDCAQQVEARLQLAHLHQAHRMERIRPDGTVIEVRGLPLAGGGFATVYQDITREKSVEAALARETASLKAVLAHMPQGISVFDEQLQLKHWNAGMIEVLNLPPEMVVEGVHFNDLIRVPAYRGEYGPGAPEQHVARISALAKQFQPHQFKRTRPSGKTHLVVGEPMRMEGELSGFITTYTDISEFEQAEQALRLSASVFENSTEGILITDANTRILKVNRAFSVMTGYEAQEALGQTPAFLQSGQQDASFYQAMWHAITEQGHWSGELWNRRKSGEIFIERLSISRVQDADGAVTHYIGIFSDISSAKAAQNQIERLSYFDALTDLPNRALLQDRLQHALLNAQRRNARVALLTIDLTRLGYINDTLGHQIGDQIIVAAAERLVSAVRAVDTVSRHLGNKFALILEDLDDAQDAAHMAERVLAVLGEAFRLEEREINIGACVGISLYPEDGNTPLLLLKNADTALHHAKGSGRFQFFREEMNAAAMERMLIENSLCLALRRQEFRVFYQAQLDFTTGQIMGMEALVRWMHPEMGLVSPMRFIPIAEETGQIVDIGSWVLRTACQDTKRWHDLGHAHLRVAVNVSARQFNQDDFADQVKQVLQDTGLSPDRLELELTESMIMQRPERVIETMEELRTLGVSFSIDDFGTGYSSLSQLKRFPINKLKIDQSFTRDIGMDADGTEITRAIIGLGTSLRLQVIAEGVETVAQQRFLIDNGCHSMQGYLFSRPIPAADFSTLLATHAADASGLRKVS